MDLKPLVGFTQVSEEEFRNLFATRLESDLLERGVKVLLTLGELSSFRVANVFHMGIQKGNASEVIKALERWCTVVVRAPDYITAQVDTRIFFDTVYSQFFMTGEDTINGIKIFNPRTSTQ